MKNDTTQNVEVQINMKKVTDFEKVKLELERKLKIANDQIAELKTAHSNDSIALKNYSEQISTLRVENDSIIKLKEQLQKSDKCLISVASNFLYLPYEAFSVKEIAIRSFETVSDSALKKKYYIRYVLLKNYKDDISNFLTFLITQKAEYSKPLRIPEETIASLHEQSFYVDYSKYDDWKSTFLGKRILMVEQQLKKYKTTKQVCFDDIIDELKECLNTENEL